MMKMTEKQARALVELEGPFTLEMLKQAYKRKVLEVHPDREGGNHVKAVELNAAYKVLKPKAVVQMPGEAPVQFQSAPALAMENHPLHNSSLPSMYSFDTLLNKTFDLQDKVMNMRDVYVHRAHREKRGTYFQYEDRTYHYYVDQFDETVTIHDVTDGGRRGKEVMKVFIKVTCYPSDLNENSRLPLNVLRPWFKKMELDIESVSLPMFVNMMKGWKDLCDLSPREMIAMNDAEFKLDRAFSDTRTYTIWPSTGGVLEFTFVGGIKATGLVNPYTLSERFKPLKEMPKGDPTITQLLRLLVNGQFAKPQINYVHTCDSSFDAAYHFRKGYIENPLALLVRWFGERKDSCTNLYLDGNELNFGRHSNESRTIFVELENDYPAVDMDIEVQALDAQLMLEHQQHVA